MPDEGGTDAMKTDRCLLHEETNQPCVLVPSVCPSLSSFLPQLSALRLTHTTHSLPFSAFWMDSAKWQPPQSPAGELGHGLPGAGCSPPPRGTSPIPPQLLGFWNSPSPFPAQGGNISIFRPGFPHAYPHLCKGPLD